MKNDHEHHRTHQRRGSIFIFITALARILGLITLAILGYVTYSEWLVLSSWNFRIYVTVVTIIVAYLELLWILDKCTTCCTSCFRSETCFYWICCMPIDNWVKTIIYISLSIPFLIPTWFLSFISTNVKAVGILLIFTGLLYFIKTFKYKRSHINDMQEDDTLFDSSNSFARPSTSTQTASMGINNDNLSSEFTINQEIHPKH